MLVLEVGEERGARAARGCTEVSGVVRLSVEARGSLRTCLLISGSPEVALWEFCLVTEVWEQEEERRELLGPMAVQGLAEEA